MPSGRMTVAGHGPELPPGSLHSLPRAGNASGTGGGEPPPPALPQMRYVCFLEGVEQDASGHGNFDKGSEHKLKRMREEE